MTIIQQYLAIQMCDWNKAKTYEMIIFIYINISLSTCPLMLSWTRYSVAPKDCDRNVIPHNILTSSCQSKCLVSNQWFQVFIILYPPWLCNKSLNFPTHCSLFFMVFFVVFKHFHISKSNMLSWGIHKKR